MLLFGAVDLAVAAVVTVLTLFFPLLPALSGLAACPKLSWSFTPQGSHASFAVGSGLLYIAAGGGDLSDDDPPALGLSALDMASGKTRWHVHLPHGSYPPESSGDSVYAVGGDGRLYALDARTGTRRWATIADEDGTDFGSPTVAAGRVYVANNRDLYAFDARTGTKLWHNNYGLVNGQGVGITHPIAVGDTVYIGANGKILALGAESGIGRWHSDDFLEPGPPVVSGNAIYTADVKSHVLYALDTATGRTRWKAGGTSYNDQVITRPIVATGALYAGTRSGVVRFDAATGQTKWTASVDDFTALGTAADGETVYAAGTSPYGESGAFVALRADNGYRSWSCPIASTTSSSVPVTAAGKVFLFSDSTLYALNTDKP
ncbi:PQQ-binding-like beta-propeller repeat protein [Streptomyces abikoensis]|uniref:outer membrane protein assembly factor BamB family protein n=1 Tax=Streptomyces abikoensis TaxID=97398 RepID=UPI0034020C32